MNQPCRNFISGLIPCQAQNVIKNLLTITKCFGKIGLPEGRTKRMEVLMDSKQLTEAHEQHLDFQSGANEPEFDNKLAADAAISNDYDQSKEAQETVMCQAPFVVMWRRSDGRLVVNGFDSMVGAMLYAGMVGGIGREVTIDQN